MYILNGIEYLGHENFYENLQNMNKYIIPNKLITNEQLNVL